MKCKQAQLTIAGLSGEAIPEDLAVHLRSCPACAELLQTDLRLRASLRSEVETSRFGFGRVLDAVAAQEQAPTRLIFGLPRRSIPVMKYTATALAASLVVTALIALPSRVNAAQPWATFAKMKKAVMAKAQGATNLGILVKAKPDGTVGAWVVVDGQLTEIMPGTVYRRTNDNGEVTVTTSSDESQLPKSVRKAMDEALQESAAESGKPQVRAFVNGKPMDIKDVQKLLKGAGINFGIQLDLDSTHYSAMKFGSDTHTLILSPKAQKNRRMVVMLDPQSDLPKSVRVETELKGKWTSVRQSDVKLN